MEDTEPAGRLTEQICRDTKPEKMPDGSYRRVMLADGRGLYLSVDQGKHRVTKSWIFRFTFAGATRQMGLSERVGTFLRSAHSRIAACVSSGTRTYISGSCPVFGRPRGLFSTITFFLSDN